VSAEVEVEDEADSGDRVEIEVRITSNESGNVVVDLRLPEGLESDSPTTVRSSLEGGLEQVISFEAEATEYLPIGEYEIILEVRDVRNLVIAEAKKTIVVKEAPLIKLPKIDIELPFVGGFKRVISAVQERLFSMVKNTTQIIYATTWLAPILILVLAGFAYLFHIWRR